MIALLSIIVNRCTVIYTEFMENFEIKSNKEFMNALLLGEMFDDFLLKEAYVKTAVTYHIDGLINREFYGNDEDVIVTEAPYDYEAFSRLRQVITGLIKGKHTPVSMKLTLYLKPDMACKLLGETDALVDYLIINISFANNHVNVTTGIAYREFTLDKEADRSWDRYVSELLADL